MNNDRFKELLNLHLDHRLSAEDARELEHMLRASPELRRTFRNYALMQRGCAELFRRSASDAPAPDSLVRALRDAEARMQARSQRRAAIWGWSTWGATAGMAALVALVVARVSQPTMIADEGQSSQVARADQPARPVALAATGPVMDAPILVRQASLPQHLTLAALGIAPERGDSPALSRWQATEEQLARIESSQSYPAWAQAGQSGSSEWAGGAASGSQFSGRPINVWAAQAGAQVQTASFTFER